MVWNKIVNIPISRLALLENFYLIQNPQLISVAIRHPCQPLSPFAIRRHASPFIPPKPILAAAVGLARRGRFPPPAAARPSPVAAKW
jgi:hypothetical protein